MYALLLACKATHTTHTHTRTRTYYLHTHLIKVGIIQVLIFISVIFIIILLLKFLILEVSPLITTTIMYHCVTILTAKLTVHPQLLLQDQYLNVL